MRGARAVLLCLLTGLALAGCMRTSAPIAVAQAPGDLDSMAYGQPHSPAPPVVASDSGGGGIAAVSASFPGPRRAYAPVLSAYAEAPVPVRYDAAYRLDAGDRLRVVVYGQEGLTNTYAIDAGGAITMPLIGAVAARGRTPAGVGAEMRAKLLKRHTRQN